MSHETPATQHPFLERRHFDALLDALRNRGYRVVGPTIQQETIVYDDISTTGDFPEGWTDEQEAGTYRLEQRDDNALFGYNVGPHSWKKFLFPPSLKLWGAVKTENGFEVEADEPNETRYAFIGVRSCELHAIGVQDRVFTGGPYQEPHYRGLRERSFIVAVNCGEAGGTCFCVSMNAGPQVTSGYDLALTELIGGQFHGFVVQIGSQAGAEVMDDVPHREATRDEVDAAVGLVEATAQSMGRQMDTDGIKELLYSNYEHPRWNDVADRCLTCASCTMVCPTCFCSTVEDTTDITGQTAERTRHWDSCFTMDFSYIHGGSIRTSGRSRYRQWMTHKLASWLDQFGTSGCVGCGRCITWCPVGIDITEEVAAIRKTSSAEGER